MSEYIAEPKFLRGRMIVKLDLSNCATNAELKKAKSADT